MTRFGSRYRVGLFFGLVAVALFFRLGQPGWAGSTPAYLFDERYTAFTAHRIAIGDPAAFAVAPRRFEYRHVEPDDLSYVSRTEWSHPMGAPLVLAAFIALLGFSPLVVRAVSMLAALSVLWATRKLSSSSSTLTASALLALDGVFFVFARTAMPHMLMTAGLACGAALLAAGTSPRRRREMLAGGALLGFACSVRWTAAPVALGNRLLWWAMVPALLFIASRIAVAVRRRAWQARTVDARLVVALAATLAMWLPWLALRRFGFSYYLLPALPFVAVMVTATLEAIERRLARGRVQALALGLAGMLFVMGYPVASGLVMSREHAAAYRRFLVLG